MMEYTSHDLTRREPVAHTADSTVTTGGSTTMEDRRPVMVLSDRVRRAVLAGLRWVRPLALAGVLLTTGGCMVGMGAVMMGGMMAGGMHGGGNELTAETAPLYAPDRVLGASDSLGLTAEQIELLQDVQDSLRAGQISPGAAARSTYGVLTPEQRRSVERVATPAPSAPAHRHSESGPLQANGRR